MTQASLDGNTVASCVVQLPRHGVWWADVELTEEVSLEGSVTLTLADASYVGTIKAGGASRGRSRYRIAGGAGAWSETVPAAAYVNDLGVKRVTLASDAAAACGETVDTSGLTGNVGPAFTRAQSAASDVLQAIAPRAWRVDVDGVTRFGARASMTISTDAPRVRIDHAAGVIVLASTTIAALVPGAIVDGTEAIDVRHELSPEGLRTTLWSAPSGQSRRREALRRLVLALLPELRWAGVYEYRIVQQHSERLDLQPVLSSLGLPDLPLVRVRPGIPGAKADHKLGALVLVAFANRDPARPVIVSFDDADSPGFIPDSVSLCAGSTGVATTERATSVEALINLIANFGLVIGPFLTPAKDAAQIAALVKAAITASAAGSIAAYTAELEAAMTAKVPDVTGLIPGLGWPDVRGG